MNTFLFIAAIVCVVAAVANIYYAQRARRLITEYRTKMEDLTLQRESILERIKELEELRKRLAKDRIACRKVHVGYTVTMNDPDGTLPESPDRSSLKALKSGIGYKTGNTMKKHIKCIREGGKTRYSLDVYLMPYNE